MKKTKLITMFAILVASAAFHSCSKLALQYDVPLQSGSVNIIIPPSADTVGATTGTATNNINIDSVIKAYTKNVLGISNITSVKLTAVTLVLNNATNTNNFANFSSCMASFSTNTNTTPYQVNIPSNPDSYSYSLSLPVDANAELKSYLSGTQFSYAAGGVLRRPTTDTLQCTINFSFNIHVQG